MGALTLSDGICSSNGTSIGPAHKSSSPSLNAAGTANGAPGWGPSASADPVEEVVVVDAGGVGAGEVVPRVGLAEPDRKAATISKIVRRLPFGAPGVVDATGALSVSAAARP
jgi:hypothetical protein